MAMVVYMSGSVFSVCLLLICCFFFSYRCGQASRLVAMGDGDATSKPLTSAYTGATTPEVQYSTGEAEEKRAGR